MIAGLEPNTPYTFKVEAKGTARRFNFGIRAGSPLSESKQEALGDVEAHHCYGGK